MRTRWIASVGLLAALAASGCGSSKKTSTTTPTTPKPAATAAGQTVKLQADPGGALKFTSAKLTASAGTVTLSMDDPTSSGKAHGIAVEGKGVDKDGPVVKPGATSTVTVKLKAGTYEFYCPIGSHKKAGMKGTLVVS